MNEFVPPTIASETISHIGSFELRNTMLTAWLVIILILIGAFLYYRKSKKLVPSGWQNLVEMFIGGILDFFESVTADAKQARRFLPVCATIFIYVLISNVLGVFPGFGTIGLWEEHAGHTILVPFFRSANSDVNMTLGIAAISVIMSQVYGALTLGFGYAGKFFVNPFKNPIGTFVGLLEMISEFAKIISFTFRLFGNIFAGEVLLVTMAFLVPFIAPLPFYALELFVAFVQALVFALLTLVFFKIAVTAHEEHDEHDEHEDRVIEHVT